MLISQENLSKVIAEQRQQGQTIVFTNGCFDIIHSGHVQYLSKAKQLADILIIGLNTDNSVSILKGPTRPINNQQDRAIVLSALKSVDFVVYFDEETPFKLINLILPDFLVKGGDYTEDSIVGADIVSKIGGKVVVIPLIEGKSSSKIIEKINK